MLINIEISSFCWSEENYAELLQVLHNKEMDFFLKHLCPRENPPLQQSSLYYHRGNCAICWLSLVPSCALTVVTVS